MEITKLIKVNSLVFVYYFIFYIIAELLDFSLFFYLKVLLGIAVFFMAGFNCAVLLKKIYNLKLDFLETVTLGVVISFFIVPLVTFLTYQLSNTVRKWLIFLIYTLTASLPLIVLLYQEKKDAKRKI